MYVYVFILGQSIFSSLIYIFIIFEVMQCKSSNFVLFQNYLGLKKGSKVHRSKPEVIHAQRPRRKKLRKNYIIIILNFNT